MPIVFAQTEHPESVRRLDVEHARLGSNEPPPQLTVPDGPGRTSDPSRLGGVKIGPSRYFCISLLRRGLQLRRQIEGILEGHALRGHRRRPRRKRLAGRAAFARDVALRHRPFLDRPDRLARHAIEYEHEAMLRQLGDGFDAAAGDVEVHQHRLRGERVVPDAMVDS